LGKEAHKTFPRKSRKCSEENVSIGCSYFKKRRRRTSPILDVDEFRGGRGVGRGRIAEGSGEGRKDALKSGGDGNCGRVKE